MESPLRSWAVFGLFLALFSASYFPVLSADYGAADDYRDLVSESAISLEDAVPDDFNWKLKPGRAVAAKITEGRPLLALATYLTYRMVKDVGDLRYVRFAGILGISLLAWIMYRILVRAGHDRVQSFCVGAIACSTLPFQVYAHWATAAPYPFAAALSGFAFILADRAFNASPGLAKWLLAGGAGAALAAALAVYQPAAMFYWVLAAAVLLDPNRALRSVFRRLGWCCMIAAPALAAGYAAAVFGPMLYPDAAPSRAGLVSDIPGKLAWFLFDPLPHALNFVLPSPSHWLLRDGSPPIPHHALDKLVAWTFLVAISSGLVLYLRGAGGGARWKFGVAVLLLFAAYIPALASESSTVWYWMLPALSSIVVVYAYLAVKGFARAFHRGRYLNVVVGAAAIVCVLSAAYHVRFYLVEPQVREWEFMRGELTRSDLDRVGRIFVIRPSPRATLAPLRRRDFGRPSSQHRRTLNALVFLVLRETAPEHANLPVTSVGFDEEPLTPPPGSLVVDMSYPGALPRLPRTGDATGSRLRNPAGD